MMYTMIFDESKIFENNEKLLTFSFRHNDILLWPFVRVEIFFKSIEKELNTEFESQPMDLKFAKEMKLKDKVSYLSKLLMYNPFFISKNFDILIIGKNGAIFKEGKWFNPVCDYFGSEHEEQTLTLDLSNWFKLNFPRYPKHVKCFDPIKVKATLQNMLFGKVHPDDKKEIEDFIIFLKNELPFKLDEKYYNELQKKLLFTSSELHYFERGCEKLFLKIQPKILFLHSAHYGGYGLISRWAKDQGIIIGEFQHGLISKGHLAYNHGNEIIKNKEYKKYFPDYLLTYGEYWNTQVSSPCKTITIGAPHFYDSIKKYEHVKQKKNSILLISQGDVTQKFVKIAKYLAETLSGHTIIYKLHPAEVFFEERYNILYTYKNINVAKSGDIFKYIAESKNIVASTSTTIFEALGLKKNIFVLDDESSKMHIPKGIGIRFKEKEEVKELIKNSEKQNTVHDLDYYFNPNWKENYEIFLRETVGIK
jgi:hypothetical protein